MGDQSPFPTSATAIWKRALSAGATEFHPLQDAFFGERHGQILDPFGHRWGLTQKLEDVSPGEAQRRVDELFGGNTLQSACAPTSSSVVPIAVALFGGFGYSRRSLQPGLSRFRRSILLGRTEERLIRSGSTGVGGVCAFLGSATWTKRSYWE
jgi:hypothetical protein